MKFIIKISIYILHLSMWFCIMVDKWMAQRHKLHFSNTCNLYESSYYTSRQQHLIF